MMKKVMMVSILAALSGCGGGSSSTPSTNGSTTTPSITVQLSGAVVDWYIQDSLVFADLNDDGVHQSADEPSVRSDANGFFDYKGLAAQVAALTNPPASYYILAKSGVDKATGNTYAATLMAESHYTNITPLTTLDVLLIKGNSNVPGFTGYSSAIADLIVQKLIGMEDKEDTLPINSNPAANKYLLSGARMLAMYNTVLVKVMGQVIRPTAAFTQDAINVKLSRDAWEQMAAQVYYEFERDLAKENYDYNKVEPKIRKESLQFMVKLMIERYIEEGVWDSSNQVGAANPAPNYVDLMPEKLAERIVDYVETVTDDDFVVSGHAFGVDGEDDDAYMSTAQTKQDLDVAAIVDEYVYDGEASSVHIDGDDDHEDYHHD